jgi:suppressor for copper-sensitivity B
MRPGWKIYWRSPGDAGFPPQPNWKGSANLASVAVAWPAPHRFDVLGLQTLGYEEEVVLPLEAAPLEPGRAVAVRATVPYLTCADICVPYEARLSLDLPAGPETSSLEAALIERFAARVPEKGPVAALSVAVAEVDGAPGAQTLRVVAHEPGGFRQPDLLIEGPEGFRFGMPKIALDRDDPGRAIVTAAVLPPPRPDRSIPPADLAGRPVVLTMIDGSRAIEQTVEARKGRMPAVPDAPASSPVTGAGFLAMLGLAVLGGLILNLMPCVLPVLSLKLLSLVGHGGADRGEVRAGFLASSAGILVSFLVLGSVAVALKAGGQAAGWGIQFQHPVFLTAMAVIVALFAANLWDMFRIRLPYAVADVAANAGGTPAGARRHGLASHFLTGAFVTLLATPCSAPFLGTAVGFALARGATEIYAIFAALGIGLALPYLAVAAAPALATRLPRPGRWMVTLRRILGLALAATAVWLLSVLHTQAGAAAMWIGGGLIVAALGLLALGRYVKGVSRRLVWPGVAVAALLAVLLPPQFARPDGGGTSTSTGRVAWRVFAPDEIAGHVAAGKAVFVDVTADWCVTCQVNKALVLDRDGVTERLNAAAVVAMRADWTRPDPAIAAFLRRFARYGIPFNVVFGPKAPGGIALPELLTRAAVLDALDAAGARRAVAER